MKKAEWFRQSAGTRSAYMRSACITCSSGSLWMRCMSLSSRSPGFRMFLQHTAADAWTRRTNTGMTATSKQVVRVLRGVHMPCSTRLRIPARTCADKRMLSTAVGAQLISSAHCLCRANGRGRDRFGCGVLHRERPPGKGTIRSLPSTAWQAQRHGVQEASGQSASS